MLNSANKIRLGFNKHHERDYSSITGFLISLFILFGLSQVVVASDLNNHWPKRVLLTNDNGIDDIKLIELAKAFAKVSETYVVAPAKDQSGTGHRTSIDPNKPMLSTRVDLGANITAYAVEGYPADCVILGLAAIMKDNYPDLVISGINGGANEGDAWLGSGTIGAARIAAYAGFPSVAISGLRTSKPKDIKVIVDWVVKFSSTDLVKNLGPQEFLTVSIPRIDSDQIQGIKLTRRQGANSYPTFAMTSNKQGQQAWQISGFEEYPESENRKQNPQTASLVGSDVEWFNKGYIAIVPMLADENNYSMLSNLEGKNLDLPKLYLTEAKE